MPSDPATHSPAGCTLQGNIVRKATIVHNQAKGRHDWVVCREAWKLFDELEQRAALRKERSRIVKVLENWYTLRETSLLTSTEERELLDMHCGGRIVCRHGIYPDRLEILAASVLPLPTSEIVSTAWIAEARDLVIAKAKATLALDAHDCGGAA